MKGTRRRCIAALGATVPALAGCLDAGGASGSHSFRHAPISVPDEYFFVARSASESVADGGVVDGIARAYERETGSGNGLLVLTEYQVSPRTEEWELAATAAAHDWTVGDSSENTVRDHRTNMVHTDASNPPLDVDDESRSDQGRWQVRLTPPVARSRRFQFETSGSPGSLSAGDLIAETTFEATFESGGLLGDESDASIATSLVYGDIDEE